MHILGVSHYEGLPTKEGLGDTIVCLCMCYGTVWQTARTHAKIPQLS